MIQYHIAVCDDESQDRERLLNLLKRNMDDADSLVIYEYGSGEELIENYRAFDALFLDISMKSMNGRETAQAVRRRDASVLLAFYTGREEYASRIVPVHPFIYMDKREDDETLSVSLRLLIGEMQRRRQAPRLLVKQDGFLLMLAPSDIVYIAIKGKGSELWLTKEAASKLRLPDGSVRSNIHLHDYYGQLREYGFIYAHKSYIVNAEYVMMRNKNSVQMVNGCILNIARSKQKEFDRELSSYLGVSFKRGESYGGNHL